MDGGGDARREEQRLRLAFENAPSGMALQGLDARFLLVNASLCEIVGYAADELLARTTRHITHPDDLDADADQVRQLLAGAVRAYSIEKRYLHADGHEVWVDLSVSLVRGPHDEPLYFVHQVVDISAERRADDDLRAGEQRLRRLVETSTVAFIAMDAGGRVTEWNHQAEVTFGWRREEVLGRRLVDAIVSPAGREAHHDRLTRFLATGEGMALGQRFELEGHRRDGREFPVELTIWSCGSGREASFFALLHDISERRRQEQQLWELALADDLTGLHNRRSFILLAEQSLKEAARAQRPVIALFVDVDHLKEINDRHGHAEGDRALRLVAEGLRAACRSSDIIGRLSGDEFAALLAEAQELDGLEGRVRERIAEAAATTGYPLSVSIGTARCAPGQDCRVDELLDRADRAMYAEKAAKRQAPPPG